MEDLKKWILDNSEQKYREFSQSLNQGREMKGVRIPILRAKAKLLAQQYGLDALEFVADDWFEEILLQGLIIGYAKELIEIKEALIYHYLCKCDCWSLVDSFVSTLKLKKPEKEIFYQVIQSWRNDEHEYVVRFVLVYCLDYYLDQQHIDDILAFSKEVVKQDSHPIRMANSWLLATAYIQYPEKVLELMDDLDEKTYRITKGKIRDSYRISASAKERFRR